MKVPDGYKDPPQLKLTAAGKHYLDGPIGITESRMIEGRTTSDGWTALRAWYVSTTATTPNSGARYPISTPTAQAENAVKDGLKIVRYNVQVELVKVR